ncbi:hypothetical protein D3C73_1581500 [compost metagenome]
MDIGIKLGWRAYIFNLIVFKNVIRFAVNFRHNNGYNLILFLLVKRAELEGSMLFIEAFALVFH